MDSTALRVLSGRVAISALAIMKDAERIPVAATLTEEVGCIKIIDLAIGEDTDTTITADARRPRTHPVAEALRQREVRAIRDARIVRV